MSPRSRHPRNRLLPDNLRERNGLYSYRNPINGSERGLGRDKAAAIRFAREANVEVHRILGQQSAAEWVRGESAKSWKAWLDLYEKILADRELSPATRSDYKSSMRRARRQWSESVAVSAITTAMVAEAIRGMEKDEGKPRASVKYRSWLKDCFDRAIANGWITANPVAVTDVPKFKTHRARLTLEHFQAIYRDTKLDGWLRNAMALAIVTGQRREDIVRLQRRDIRDGHLWVEQHKTRSRVAIPLAIRLDVFGMTLEQAIDQCKHGTLISHHLIYRTIRAGHVKPGAPITAELVTKRFTDAVLRLEVDWGEKSHPTFHEIRSLSKRLYDAQGGVDTKQLLGHKYTQTSDIYSDARGGWVKVSVR